jgi:hypothetical protein
MNDDDKIDPSHIILTAVILLVVVVVVVVDKIDSSLAYR